MRHWFDRVATKAPGRKYPVWSTTETTRAFRTSFVSATEPPPSATLDPAIRVLSVSPSCVSAAAARAYSSRCQLETSVGSLCHACPICREPTPVTMSSGRRLDILPNDPWMTSSDSQQRDGRPFGTPAILFPVSKCMHTNADGLGELSLGESDEPSQRDHILP